MPNQTETGERRARKPQFLYLTKPRLRILRSGQGEAGAIRMPYLTGFESVSWKRNVAFLAERGLLQANAHGDFYLTEAGHVAIRDLDHA